MIESLKKIYSLFPRSEHVKLLVLFAMMFLASLLEVLGIAMIPGFIGAVSDPQAVLDYPVVGDWLAAMGITTSREMVLWGACAMIAIYLFKNLYLAFFTYLKKKYVADRGVELQDRIFKAYMTAPYSFYINRNSAELLRNVAGEVNKLINGTVMPFLELTLNVIMFTFIMGGLIFVEPIITLVSMVVLGGFGGFFLHYTKQKTNEYAQKDREARAEKNKAVLEGLGGLKDARILNREGMFLDRYHTHADLSKRASIYRFVISRMPKYIIETLAVLGILMIAIIMITEGRSNTEILTVLGMFGAATVKLMPVIQVVISQVTNMRYNAFSVYAVYDDLMLLENQDNPLREKILDGGKEARTEIITLQEQIEVDSVDYSYPNSEEVVLKDIDITVPRGSVVALVGATGAGKTTLVDLILGLLEPTRGTIKVDGKEIGRNLRGWMKNIGYIPQSMYLLDDSIARNIAFGIPEEEIDQEKLWDAISAAQLGDFIKRLPKGADTVIGERGVRLSGGQQQRVGIARALYNNPQVLIMDEATSSLDNLTEKFVVNAIEELRGDRTIIMIAHRLTTVKNCDVIYMMKEGRVVDWGTYDELLDKSRDFRQMSLIE